MRRGHPTPNTIFGIHGRRSCSATSPSRRASRRPSTSRRTPPRLLVTTVREMTVGELQEEFLKGSWTSTMNAYMGVASRKTGALFEWAGAVLSELSRSRTSRPIRRAWPARPASSCRSSTTSTITRLPERVSGKDEAPGPHEPPAHLALHLRAGWPRGPRGVPRPLERRPTPPGDRRASSRSAATSSAPRDKGRELVDSMPAMVRKLPCKAEAAELAFFVETHGQEGILICRTRRCSRKRGRAGTYALDEAEAAKADPADAREPPRRAPRDGRDRGTRGLGRRRLPCRPQRGNHETCPVREVPGREVRRGALRDALREGVHAEPDGRGRRARGHRRRRRDEPDREAQGEVRGPDRQDGGGGEVVSGAGSRKRASSSSRTRP